MCCGKCCPYSLDSAWTTCCCMRNTPDCLPCKAKSVTLYHWPCRITLWLTCHWLEWGSWLGQLYMLESEPAVLGWCCWGCTGQRVTCCWVSGSCGRQQCLDLRKSCTHASCKVAAITDVSRHRYQSLESVIHEGTLQWIYGPILSSRAHSLLCSLIASLSFLRCITITACLALLSLPKSYDPWQFQSI